MLFCCLNKWLTSVLKNDIYIFIVISQEVNMFFLVILWFNEFINQTIIKAAVTADEQNVRPCIEAFIQNLQSPRQQFYTVTVSI